MIREIGSLGRKLGKLSSAFVAHSSEEEKRWKSIDDGIKDIDTRLTNIRLNGDGKTYTMEEAFGILYELVRDRKERRDFVSKWKTFRDGSNLLHFLFTAKLGKGILFGFFVYVIASIANDLGTLPYSPWEITKAIFKFFFPHIP